MGISKAQAAVYAEIEKTEKYLLHGDICLTEATEHLMETIRKAVSAWYSGDAGRVDAQQAYHKAFVMLAKVTKGR